MRLLNTTKIPVDRFESYDSTAISNNDFYVVFCESDSSLFDLNGSSVLYLYIGKSYSLRKQEGKLVWFMSITDIMLPQIYELVISFHDSVYAPYSELNKTNKKLIQEAHYFELFFKNTPANIYIKDLESRFIKVNSEWLGYVGVDPDFNLTGKTDFDIFDSEHAQAAYDDEQEIMRTGIPKIAYEEKEILPDGRISWCLSSKMPIIDESGKIVGLSGISYDISKQKLAQEKLRETNSQLRAANRRLDEALEIAQKSTSLEKKNKELIEKEVKLKEANETISQKKMLLELLNKELTESNNESRRLNEELQQNNKILSNQNEVLAQTLEELKSTQTQLVQSEKLASVGILTSGIAHEINNPLNFISGSVRAIEQYLEPLETENKETLEKLLNAANIGIERATTIVKSLNRFNRKSERMDEACDIKIVIENCLIMLENKLKNKIQITTEYDKINTIQGNEGELHQVILNLIINAVQSIQNSGNIIIKTRLNESNFFITVQDDGIGIKKENLSKVTSPFFTTKAPGEGTGLGMSIAYSIIQKHKGQINYKSEYEKGTEAVLIFPIKQAL
ncbi:ATP-binding protein [Reichenbachiella versicolor]|uniref:ATP-binding protein n=1 Tax=Reichenbachiella versicolor TaxID=1821036 RepID=UPI000D6DE072|nr:ATP-binding protein [Reichenbachiella versicolor]